MDTQHPAPATTSDEPWPPPFWSGARITHRKLTFRSRYSRMAIAEGGRLTLTSRKGVDLDVHISELVHLHAPLWMLMCGLYFEAAGKKWYVTFSEVREIDWAVLRTMTPQLGLALAEIQDLKNQALLSMVWMMLLDPTTPAPAPAPVPAPTPDAIAPSTALTPAPAPASTPTSEEGAEVTGPGEWDT
jgi:hypothetical protein